MPSKEEVEGLKKGDIVKVSFFDDYGAERMWTVVDKIDEAGYVTAILDNTPILMKLKVGNKVKFHVTDIIAIMDGIEP